jgi:ribosomal protein S18 acetylase RimI-like enzyme
MTDAEYDAWSEGEFESYAADVARASGMSLDDARDRSRKQHAELLPDGVRTAGHALLIVCAEDDAAIGIVWLGPHPQRPDVAYVYNVEIAEAMRGRGYGRAAMLAAEQYAREHGSAEIGLNVFGFNERARALYDSLGYAVVATQMLKRLD